MPENDQCSISVREWSGPGNHSTTRTRFDFASQLLSCSLDNIHDEVDRID